MLGTNSSLMHDHITWQKWKHLLEDPTELLPQTKARVLLYRICDEFAAPGRRTQKHIVFCKAESGSLQRHSEIILWSWSKEYYLKDSLSMSHTPGIAVCLGSSCPWKFNWSWWGRRNNIGGTGPIFLITEGNQGFFPLKGSANSRYHHFPSLFPPSSFLMLCFSVWPFWVLQKFQLLILFWGSQMEDREWGEKVDKRVAWVVETNSLFSLTYWVWSYCEVVPLIWFLFNYNLSRETSE